MILMNVLFCNLSNLHIFNRLFYVTWVFFRDRRYEFVVCNFEWRQDEEELVIG